MFLRVASDLLVLLLWCGQKRFNLSVCAFVCDTGLEIDLPYTGYKIVDPVHECLNLESYGYFFILFGVEPNLASISPNF